MSLTDGTFICGLCGEDWTGCSLCGKDGAPLVDMRPQLEQKRREAAEADRELWRQEMSIRKSAEDRRRNQ